MTLMNQMDTLTISIVLGVMGSTFAIIFSALSIEYKTAYMKYFALSYVLLDLSFIILVMEAQLPTLFRVLIGNGLLLVSQLLYGQGIADLVEEKIQWRIYWIIIALHGTLAYVFTVIHYSTSVRILLVSMAQLIFISMFSAKLGPVLVRRFAIAGWVAVAGFLGYFVTNAFRVIEILWIRAYPSIFSNNLTGKIYFLGLFISVLVAIVGSLLMITKKMAIQVEETNKRLYQELHKEKNMDAMRRSFVANVSHELKNPIGIIQAYADGLSKGMAKTEARRLFYQETIVEEAQRMSLIITDLLDLSAYEAGTMTLNKRQVDLNLLIEKAIEVQRPRFEDKGIHLSYEAKDDLMVIADGIRIEQIFVNLISNAYKYTHADGSVHVTGKKDRQNFHLLIGNSGEVLSDKLHQEIWKSFYQKDGTMEGNGLGLPIVANIANLHGGYARSYSENARNYFEVVLPIK